jgi:hypothetical protein
MEYQIFASLLPSPAAPTEFIQRSLGVGSGTGNSVELRLGGVRGLSSKVVDSSLICSDQRKSQKRNRIFGMIPPDLAP